MIRPFTCICFLLACISGLYLYQSKHRVQLLDRQIEDTVHATEVLREQTRVLHAEWTLLNDPQRLQTLADQFLNLKTVQPGQFTSMADLDSRLPPVPPPPAATPDEPPSVPVAEAPVPPKPDVAVATEAPPVQPKPVAAEAPVQPKPVAVAAAPPPSVKPVAVAAAAPAVRPQEHKASRPSPVPVAAEVPRVRPVAAVVRSPIIAADVTRPVTPAPYTGSSLGMARSVVPLPQPVPFGATPFHTDRGGG